MASRRALDMVKKGVPPLRRLLLSRTDVSCRAGVREWQSNHQRGVRAFSSYSMASGNNSTSSFINSSYKASSFCGEFSDGGLSSSFSSSSSYRVAPVWNGTHGQRQFAAAAAMPSYQEIAMPALSPTMSQGNLVKWHVKEGDKVAPGDVLCEIETDKATLDMESQEDGFVAKILVSDGKSDIAVGHPIAIMVEDEGDISKFADFKLQADGGASAAGESSALPPPPSPSPSPSVAASPVEEPVKSPSPSPSSTTTSRVAAAKEKVESDGRIFVSPAAKKFALDNGVDLSAIAGSGPEGRIVRSDVEAFIASGKATATPVAEAAAAPKKAAAAATAAAKSARPSVEGTVDYLDIPHTMIRKITASRLLMSKQTIPHYYLNIDARVDKLNELREKLNAKQAQIGGKKLSINDFVVKASALALRKVPEVNSSWQDDVIRQYNNVDVTVAVQTEAGLMVPFIKNADKKGIAAISEEVKVLADKAKLGKLTPAEFQGGTFTISNLGMFGIKQFAAIVNPPQAAILAVGASEKRVVTKADGDFESGTFMTVTLSCDHRVVDGAVGAQWLQAFKSFIEDPMTMLL